ncbi:MAG TPA: tRNA (adenosine(37)-N6)-dimethylallyltransferase MiaA, partial [Chitinophagaceae bacterium]|nr:tRNA (adenosine(37)-N6)-dimethylallyltransferase MiaA [Chitinophagaceae bacterium]
MNKTCIVIVGPTAVGKTPFAIEIARHFETDIISADSRQCYRELNIGVAKPSSHYLQQVKHYFINSHSIHHEVNAKLFEEYALQSVYEIFASHEVAVVVGGTGLYVKAFCEGLDAIPEVDPEIRKRVISSFKANGLPWLQKEIEQQDPRFFSMGEIQNPQRMMRALEVKLSTGRSVVEFHSHRRNSRDFKIVKAGLNLPKEQLHQNINARVNKMMEEGLLDEVKALYPCKNINALQTVAYNELFDHLEGKISLDKAIEQIKT